MIKRICCPLFSVILILFFSVSAFAYGKVMIGGEPFGIKIYTGDAVVVKLESFDIKGTLSCPAELGGIKAGDIIKAVNDKEVSDSEGICNEIQNSNGIIKFSVVRDNISLNVNVTPFINENGDKKTGMWLRDSTAGIGTVTFIVPSSGEFVGLGHGIYNADSGKLIEMTKGTVSNVSINGANKGIPGNPGELKGFFTATDKGVILQNNDKGVYGILNNVPNNKTVEIAERKDIHNGKVTILSTVYGTSPDSFDAEILINDNNSDCFNIIVRDNDLIEKTGGIVQGMSGSPVIQDGKLVGAVTHVLVDNPLCGYGIYVDSMIKEFNITVSD